MSCFAPFRSSVVLMKMNRFLFKTNSVQYTNVLPDKWILICNFFGGSYCHPSGVNYVWIPKFSNAEMQENRDINIHLHKTKSKTNDSKSLPSSSAPKRFPSDLTLFPSKWFYKNNQEKVCPPKTFSCLISKQSHLSPPLCRNHKSFNVVTILSITLGFSEVFWIH